MLGRAILVGRRAGARVSIRRALEVDWGRARRVGAMQWLTRKIAAGIEGHLRSSLGWPFLRFKDRFWLVVVVLGYARAGTNC